VLLACPITYGVPIRSLLCTASVSDPQPATSDFQQILVTVKYRPDTEASHGIVWEVDSEMVDYRARALSQDSHLHRYADVHAKSHANTLKTLLVAMYTEYMVRVCTQHHITISWGRYYCRTMDVSRDSRMASADHPHQD
jgi:hypothetical protein